MKKAFENEIEKEIVSMTLKMLYRQKRLDLEAKREETARKALEKEIQGDFFVF